MLNFVCVFVGGGLGALLRYLLNLFIERRFLTSFPLSTFFVNILGCFILGIFFYLFLEKANIPKSLKLFVTVGFCGGLTTFSSFSLDIYKYGETSGWINSVFYAILSVVVGFLCFLGGLLLCKNILS